MTLIRGMLEVLHDSPTVLPYCYSLGSQRSWWSTNISESVEGFRDLTGMSRQDAARVIADDELDVLVDLNGHTLATGLPAMGLQPAPIQVSFLGYLATTATPFVNYVIGDRVGTPPTQAKYYSEKLALMPASFLVNDYPQLHGHVLELPRTSPHDAGITTQAGPRGRPPFVFASFSNYQKIDPAVFDVWMNVLRRVPNSVLWLIHHHAHQVSDDGQRGMCWGSTDACVYRAPDCHREASRGGGAARRQRGADRVDEESGLGQPHIDKERGQLGPRHGPQEWPHVRCGRAVGGCARHFRPGRALRKPRGSVADAVGGSRDARGLQPGRNGRTVRSLL